MQDISFEVLLKASEGDVDSFEVIYKATSVFVYNVAFRVLNNKEEAEEVTQEVFLTVYHKLKMFRFESSFKTWVYRIAVNRAINHFRKMAKERNRHVEYDDNLVSAKFLAKEDSGVGKAPQEELVASLFSVLNPDQKACVVLRSIEGLSYQEIADTLRININTVRSRLKRARETLLARRKEVKENEL